MVSVPRFAASVLLPSLPLFFYAGYSLGPIYGQPSPLGQVTIEPRAKRPPLADFADGAGARLRIDVPLVLVPVHVTTSLGATVTDLGKEAFHLFEDNVEQKITNVSTEDAPLSVGLVFDASSSMRGKIAKSSEAASRFLRTTGPDDEFFLIEFNERPRLALGFTQKPADIEKRILHMRPVGRTSLLDAITMALSQMKSAHNLRKAIVILSDGGDNHSRRTESEIKRAIREADVQVYAMGIVAPDTVSDVPEERNGPMLLDDLARESGGDYFPVESLDDLPGICARIGNELRTQYVLGYSPANPAHDGKYRRLKVTLTPAETGSPLRVSHRMGYYAAPR